MRIVRAAIHASGLWALALALSACPPPYPNCKSDEQCKDHNESCVQGQCQQCAVDKNCPKNFVCQAYKCVPKPECKTDDDCGETQGCKAGKCAPLTLAEVCATCAEDEECTNGQCVKRAASVSSVAECRVPAIRFGFNDTLLTPDARKALDAAMECLKNFKGRIVLEGHADERGTEEYNLQLSNRRAATVKKYLTDLGLKDKKLQTVGYGENKPASEKRNEEGWAVNRRVEFVDK
jgi:peptidoglycan-associated lipoprotein